MPRAAYRVCNVKGCPVLTNTGARCEAHQTERDQSRLGRGYNTKGHERFRAAVLARSPVCVRCRRTYATVADHYPRSRKQLIAAGLNPNDPAYGRALCKSCHDRETAVNQPGGWNNRQRIVDVSAFGEDELDVG